MAQHIPILFSGGTIGTTIHGGQMDTDPAASLALLSLYRKRKDALPVEFTVVKNLGVLSENMTPIRWNELLGCLRELLQNGETYDGIVIAHGTDTLAYTAAMLSVLCQDVPVPIMLVSSHQPILKEDGTPNPDANGVDNFAAAVTAIAQGINSGVYVPYRNKRDGQMHLHKGDRITQCPVYSDDFSSLAFASPQRVKNNTPPLFTLQQLQDCVLMVEPYVGLNYRRIGLDGVKAVLHGVYHSGTACVDDGQSDHSLLTLAGQCSAAGIPLYLSPAKTSKEKTVYASVPALEQADIRFCYGHTKEWLYAALTYAYSADLTEEEIKQLIQWE